MLKIFFYPLYFRLKRLGPERALVISTLVVFFATWVLHAYQWFWLRGQRAPRLDRRRSSGRFSPAWWW